MRFLFLLLLTPMMYAQTWVKVAAESQTTSVTLPAGTIYRFGDNNKWSASTTVATATTFKDTYFPDGVFPFADPDVGTVKELDVLETSAPQSIAVIVGGTPSTVTVPALPPVSPPPAGAPTVVAVYSCTLTYYSDGSFTVPCTVVTPPVAASPSAFKGTAIPAYQEGESLRYAYAYLSSWPATANDEGRYIGAPDPMVACSPYAKSLQDEGCTVVSK